jgi:hypothetical protein
VAADQPIAFAKEIIMKIKFTVGSLAGLVGIIVLSLNGAHAQASGTGKQDLSFDFSDEKVGEAPKSFVPVVGNWHIGKEHNNLLLVVDGTNWSKGQAAAGIAERAKSIYGQRYAEFLDNVKAFAYYPYAVATECADFRNGQITMRFKTIAGKIDQGAGILFNLKLNGDYLALRANPLENNLVLWRFERGKRSPVKWVKDAPTASKVWHELKLVVDGRKVTGFIDGKLLLEHRLDHEVSGRVGIWSKADSVVYFDDFSVKQGK